MPWETITKSWRERAVLPNLRDYARARAEFSWEAARRELGGLPCGLVAPALYGADRLGLDELMRQFRDLVNRARSGSLRSSELSDLTITVTSLGEQGVEAVFGIIYPPQVALVGFSKVVERPWSADHRVCDGHRGGLFLAAVDRILQEPSQL